MGYFLAFVLLVGVFWLCPLVWLAVRQHRFSRELESLEVRLIALRGEFVRSRPAAATPGAQPADAPTGAPVARAVAPALQPAPPTLPPPAPAPSLPAAPPPIPLPPPPPPIPSALPPSRPAIPALAPPTPAGSGWPAVDWERFMGVKLFAWVGGFALFLAVVFFIKWSFDNNLVTPELRVVSGFLTGLGLLGGGVVLKKKAYEVTSQTLCATGVVILYATTFAANGYGFLGQNTAFLVMVLVTAAAFALAVRLNALVVAILGLVGGFLTPPLLSQDVDRPFALFAYTAILDAGLIAVALRRRWHFLVALALAGTVAMIVGWTDKFFVVEKAPIAIRILLTFNILYLAALALSESSRRANAWFAGAAAAMPAVTLIYSLWLMGQEGVGGQPSLIFGLLLGADLCVLLAVVLRPSLHWAQAAAGGGVFLALTIWTSMHLKTELLDWALGAYFVFALLHTVFPLALQRFRPGARPVWWAHLFPMAALLLALAPLLKELELSALYWPYVLVVDVVAILVAVTTASVLTILAAVLLTGLAAAVWLVRIPANLTGLPEVLLVIGGFAALFCAVGWFAGKRMRSAPESGVSPRDGHQVEPSAATAAFQVQVPAFSTILPFLLLILTAVRLPLADPSPVFGLALLLVVVLLSLGRALQTGLLAPVALASMLGLEYAWHSAHFSPELPLAPLAWNVGFAALFVVYPFLCQKAFARQVLPWATAALSGPLHFYLVYKVIKLGYPNDAMGLLPAAFALPMLGALYAVVRSVPRDAENRNALLAWLGGSALFFITLVFPIQFDRQWITLGWALEGAALLWLFHRVPQPGLRLAGVLLLGAAFVRLVFNPAVLHYHERTGVPILNWYLYTYGLVAACLWAGARWLAVPQHRLLGVQTSPVLYGLGTVLLFALLNLEIADYFSPGPQLELQFDHNFGRDMTYSLGWALFALAMLSVGVWKALGVVRYAAMGLLAVTILKLFLHDLVTLSALYRIGAFMGVALISIAASVLYQRFFARPAPPVHGP